MSYDWTRTAVPNLMHGLLGDLVTALATTAAGAPDRALVVPGTDAAWDNCQCGQLSIARGPVYRSRGFPTAATDVYTKCDDTKIVVPLAVSMVRCVRITSDNNVPPSPAASLKDLQTQEEDAWVVWNTLTCSLQQLQSVNLITDYIVNDQSTVGPLGACAGTLTNLKVGLFAPCPCTVLTS